MADAARSRAGPGLGTEDASSPKIVSIVGTRPEAIKMEPVVRALAERGLEQEIILTGQHRGIASTFDFLPAGQVRELAINMEEQSAGEISETIHFELCDRLDRREASLVIVQGDTSTAYAGAMAARDRSIALAHVEAGLRTHDLQQPWPEEGNRVTIDALADLLFAPSEQAARNLAAEPAIQGTVHVTGNSGIDALFAAPPAPSCLPPPEEGCKRILLTCHRRENQGEPLRQIARACRRMARELPVEIVLPLHPNPQLRRTLERLLGGVAHIRLVEPLGHRATISLMAESWLVLTDSGGIQEEAPALGKPVLVLRNVTERAEAIETDNAELVGTDADRIVRAVTRLVEDEDRYRRMATPSLPFGDGHASARIADAIEQFLAGPTQPPVSLRFARPDGEGLL
ncbi:MAG: UDP-N-acetylglucosamine 2-epimerase [uncultured Sphingosinicella sp.]|uniref:UDP-N-acetylglucosamine 2-epimerase (non-hydrolyzing) n=1 Tax=uncultured Sphingosinicella sp. TaxID=478748 RepID=A0A6J4TUQ0_9SPHN|nr:UDP-N-acetylglucosamine 2-epimerase (non-hydrolyzing) [uncultured Sphingosinicella sp.]CAA9532724.1 MAG: UDP-N-acetylglucosamine 2-epimerase [uncultured Sphingosinicella sp.]